jgi:hypothetical protein
MKYRTEKAIFISLNIFCFFVIWIYLIDTAWSWQGPVFRGDTLKWDINANKMGGSDVPIDMSGQLDLSEYGKAIITGRSDNSSFTPCDEVCFNSNNGVWGCLRENLAGQTLFVGTFPFNNFRVWVDKGELINSQGTVKAITPGSEDAQFFLNVLRANDFLDYFMRIGGFQTKHW